MPASGQRWGRPALQREAQTIVGGHAGHKLAFEIALLFVDQGNTQADAGDSRPAGAALSKLGA